ncbi:MAG TPA: lipid-binding SYLF domain-containing protein, partial [Terriglobales bacterium]|nr:lipid-binding SYLF domain-containing protein [Terriglobales bacterium]
MRKSLVLLLVCFLTCFLATIPSANADDTKAADTKAAEPNTKASERVASAGTVLDEIQAAPDERIPEEVLASADCVAVVPSLLNAGFVFGGRYGRGVASCRTEKGWSAPAFFVIGGGS